MSTDSPVASSNQKMKLIGGIEENLHDKIVAMVGNPVRGKITINTVLAQQLHNGGFSYKQIGLCMGCSGYTVKRRLHEAGLI